MQTLALFLAVLHFGYLMWQCHDNDLAEVFSKIIHIV